MSVLSTRTTRPRRRAWAGGLTAAGTLAVTLALAVPGTASAAPASAPAAAPQAAPAAYAGTLNGWIIEALDVMRLNGIPGTYEGLHRNIMRESSGNPLAVNNWDINAVNGTPSKGLLQVIDPTFRAYWVPGTPNDPFHPVANIAAAANYAADRYGSIDNVFGPY
ncbi:transglycosylase SLT domain-containing protein [Streptomyces tsukubensis]|uniref:transglycosylase SLT domain-containing protein n=1 Tax=Streptomyces tsukubensis TaxID=83656 RepID=UPI00344C4474